MKPSRVVPILVSFAAILVSCSVTAAATSQNELVPGLLRAILPSTYPEKACDGTRSAACTSCNQLKVCVTSDITQDDMNPRQDCPGATPFCSMSATSAGAVCQKTSDTSVAECAAVQSNFKCTGVGFFANPNSCQLFHYCSGPGAVPEDYDCPDGYKFSSKANACAYSYSTCPSFTCNVDNPDSIYQPLPADSQYYVYCAYDRTVNPPRLTDTFVFSCGQGSTYNPTTSRCVFTCLQEGLFANTANLKQYHQCYYSNGRLVYNDMSCNVDQMFDEVTKRCVKAVP